MKIIHSLEIDLHRVDPAKRMARFYHAALWPDLFGGVTLVRALGRIPRSGKLRVDANSDPAAAQAHARPVPSTWCWRIRPVGSPRP